MIGSHFAPSSPNVTIRRDENRADGEGEPYERDDVKRREVRPGKTLLGILQLRIRRECDSWLVTCVISVAIDWERLYAIR